MASEKERLQAKQAHREKKRKVIEHYSKGAMKCRCGFSDIRALSIDHIDGGGLKHLRQIKSDFYSWLIKNNYPVGFQVLCMNCQWIKRAENNETAKKRPRKWRRHTTESVLTRDYWASLEGSKLLDEISTIQNNLT